ncbi:four-carbon acid sugar kinase family protein [Actinopolyspora halophila]|uniref:four-carbon acid sugar kinase family protein n=1 Tax=Actinopolyspora halophila TaxID=1850 RepID=UPI0003A98754|nr:four-carbon acid sugar kinase family protein [Actinopolyspora halophila]
MEESVFSGVLALADDLSGAAETAVLLSGEVSARIELSSVECSSFARNTQNFSSGESVFDPRASLVLDLDSRQAAPERAERAVRETLRTHVTGFAPVFFKIDSLARGNVGAAIRAADGPVVLAPALPVGGRTVRGGVIHVHGQPLHRTELWRAEAALPAESLAETVAPSACRTVGLDTVRSGELSVALADCTGAGLVAVCDAETDADLDAVVAATTALPGVRLIGSGGLAGALGRAARTVGNRAEPPSVAREDLDNALLVVVGTADPGAAEQVRELIASGAEPVEVDVAEATSEEVVEVVARVSAGLRRGPVVVTSRLGGEIAAGRSREFVRLLAETARRAVACSEAPVDLVLTGGETARRVLEAVEVDALFPRGQVHHGAVHSHTPGGTSVVTRPGSFGGPDSLVRIVRHLRPISEG